MKVTLTGHILESVNSPTRVRAVVRAEYFLIKVCLIVLDLFLTYLAFRVAYTIRFSSGLSFFQESIVPGSPRYVDFMWLIIPIWLFIFAALGLYNQQNLLGGTREYALLLNATTLGMFVIISAGFLLPDELILARGWVLLVWLLGFLYTAFGRFLFRRVVYALRRTGRFQTPALLVGLNDEGKLLADQFSQTRSSSIRLVGYIHDAPADEKQPELNWLGKLQDLENIISKYGVREIILTSSALSQEQVLSLFRQYGTSDEVTLRMSSGLYEIITTGMEIREDGLVPLLTINKVRMTGIDRVLKQVIDYAIAIPVIIMLLPVFAVIAALIRLDSPGPIIYRRRVMGVNGKRFDAYKFRTMRVNGDDIFKDNPELLKEYQANYKLKNDPRVTRIGNFLRKTSLDEFPQFVNVLRNEMSIVGPRMISPEELGKYQQWNINLLTVKPGITGLWQVRGRSDVDYDERVRMDMYYIRNWSAWLDMALIIQTVPAILSKRGAY